MFEPVPFSTLIGMTLSKVEGLAKGQEEVTFTTVGGRTFRMMHHQDCCEGVDIEDVNGDVADLLDTPILDAREDSNSDDPALGEYTESWTWTYYNLRTVKGSVNIRWYGTSNGYYSERVSFEELDPKETAEDVED